MSQELLATSLRSLGNGANHYSDRVVELEQLSCGPRTVIPSPCVLVGLARILGLVSMPTIHRQLRHSLLQAQLLTFIFVFGAVRRLTYCSCRSKFTAKRKVDSENQQFEQEWTETFAFILPPTSTHVPNMLGDYSCDEDFQFETAL